MKPIDDNHITIQGWMRTALNLKGERLQAFALVYGFSQDGESQFYGSLKYVMEWLGCSKPTAIAILDYLTNLHLITKHTGKTGIESNRYTVNAIVVDALRQERARVVKELNRGGKESLPVVVKNFNHSGKKSLPDSYNNKDIDNNIESARTDFLVTTVALETIPTVEGEVPRPAARPTSKISDVQANPNAFSDAAEYFLRLIEAKKYDLGNAAKYAVPYFRHKQQTGKWIALCLPSGIQEEQRWLGEHMAGVRAWADNQVKFDLQRSGTPAPATSAPIQIRREI